MNYIQESFFEIKYSYENLLHYLLKEYWGYIDNSSNRAIPFMGWLNEAEKCDYYKKEVTEFKKII